MAKKRSKEQNANMIGKFSFEDYLNLKKITQPEVLASSIPSHLSILPLRDLVIYPNMIFPVLIGRAPSLAAINEAMDRDKFVFVAAQKDPLIENLEVKHIHKYGTISKIIQVLRLPNNLLKVLIEGFFQAKIVKKIPNENFLEAEIRIIEQNYDIKDKELGALMRRASSLFEEYVEIDKNIPHEVMTACDTISEPAQKLYYIAANVRSALHIKQSILEITDIYKQYFELNSLLLNEIELKKLENEIDIKVHDTIQKNQRKYYIQEQIRVLTQELGEDSNESIKPDIQKIKELLEKANLPAHAKEKTDEELERLQKMHPMSPDYTTNRNYLEIVGSLPWNNLTADNCAINNVKQILDKEHYGLEKPKERILEYIAVLNLSGNLKKQILCFVGPPGTGKTSLAKSISHALSRKFVRISLGGVRDEAEIRGHRRTYVGAMPGKIIQSMKKAGTINPVILLDEIDKMATDFRGDPSAALLEVLDPEQNVAFNDHFVEIDYDLSNVMFITTANVKHEIPIPLLDRMEIIELTSYLDFEKLNIARLHIFPKLLQEFGLNKLNISLTDDAILKIIRDYTREAGVRNLEREIASILRKVAKDIVSKYSTQSTQSSSEVFIDKPGMRKKLSKFKLEIDSKYVAELLKAPKFKDSKEKLNDKIGVAMGLAWTSVGGEILPVEVSIMPSAAEKLTLTGKLGDVMKESATAALSFVRSNYKLFDLPEDFYTKKEIHVHVPEGAIPKDGPSAGVTISIAIISAVGNIPIKGNIAMTGEVNLRGEVLPIGGLKEKLLAAKRTGMKKALIPKGNMKDMEDIPNEITEGMEVWIVDNVYSAFAHCAGKKDKNALNINNKVR